MSKQMSNCVRIECLGCGSALRVESETLPWGLQSDELFEKFCPTCEREVFMRLSQTLGKK